MADRPEADTASQPASYSPPPNRRPEWLARGWGQPGASPTRGTQGTWTPAVSTPAEWTTSSSTTTPGSIGLPPATGGQAGNGPQPGRLRASAAIALVAALLASLGTYALLAASGQLARQTDTAPAVTGASRAASGDPDIVRVVEESAVTSAVDKVSPAVVTIMARLGQGENAYTEGVGSGVIFDPAGWVVTNRHVVCDADSLSVQLEDGQRYDGEVIGLDTLTDLAIVKIDGTGLPAVSLGNSSTLKVGQHAIAIGSPLGTFTNSVTTGVVSAMGRRIDVADECSPSGQLESLRDLIQTDAAINPGNSGGALVDADGDLIGINTAIAGDAQGIGFAIPVNLAQPIMQQALEGETLSRPWIGIWYTALTPVEQDQRGLLLGYGALIEPPEGLSGSAVVAGSPADLAGLRDGDIITHVDGTRVDGENPLDAILTQYRPGETVTLRVLRDEEVLDLALVLGVRPAS
jgi:serine protease Do